MREINGYNYIEVPSIELHQPIGDGEAFYVATIGFKELLHIVYTDTRKLDTHTTELEEYIGIQRLLSESRVKEIASYVTAVDATFPSGIIVQVDENASIEEGGEKKYIEVEINGHTEILKNVIYEADKRNLLIRFDENVAKVLDGQHRIEGLRRAQEEIKTKFDLNVTIFIDMDIEDQAITFATINKSQTKVNKSLVSDLFEYAKTRSPQKAAHNIARALNQKEGSPFKKKIKILGVAEHESETITQATFVGSLLRYISGNNLGAMKDRDIYKRGGTPERASGSESKRLFLRNFIIDNRDGELASLLWNYFSAVSEKWPDAWGQVRVDNILNKSTGFVALVRFLKDAYLHFNEFPENPVIIPKEKFAELFGRIDINQGDFNKLTYIPGGIGQSKLYNQLRDQSGI